MAKFKDFMKGRVAPEKFSDDWEGEVNPPMHIAVNDSKHGVFNGQRGKVVYSGLVGKSERYYVVEIGDRVTIVYNGEFDIK